MTNLTHDDFEALGRAWFSLVSTSTALGHESVTNSSVYLDREALPPASQVVLDSFTAALIGDSGHPSRERVYEFVIEHGGLQMIGEAVTR